ncbi:hypothetical protein MRB53_016800 [Persea americana]|uniref:Uncharacterized protein n=1 Tax=Persea americana TaxID=3435 RepID=A0ACC2M2V9_PERAE|nr:hypothetical protein MRB53_016800 [Persea americana]
MRVSPPFIGSGSSSNVVASGSLPCLSDKESGIWLIFRLSVTCVSFLFGNGAAAAKMETHGIFLLGDVRKKLARDGREGQPDLQTKTRSSPPFTGSGSATKPAVVFFFSGKTITLIALPCSLSSPIKTWCPAKIENLVLFFFPEPTPAGGLLPSSWAILNPDEETLLAALPSLLDPSSELEPLISGAVSSFSRSFFFVIPLNHSSFPSSTSSFLILSFSYLCFFPEPDPDHKHPVICESKAQEDPDSSIHRLQNYTAETYHSLSLLPQWPWLLLLLLLPPQPYRKEGGNSRSFVRRRCPDISHTSRP